MLDRLEAHPDLPEEVQADVATLIDARPDLLRRFEQVADMAASGGRSRIHGDYHLGQVLVAQNDVAIIDFEGEPGRTLEERRAKSSPLRDVAGMLRSFDYAAALALERHVQGPGQISEAALARAQQWQAETRAGFLAAYREHSRGASSLPEDPVLADALLELFLLQKAIYEIRYEMGNRPAWVHIPLRGVLDLLGAPPG